jgi:3',5'-cyclic AMP phosphodiesterase CpdA
MGLRIVHVTDTHYATKQDNIHFHLSRGGPSSSGLLGQFVSAARSVVVSQNGCARAEHQLWQLLLTEIASEAQAASSDEFVVVHTGDVTQAGQLRSLLRAHQELRQASGPSYFSVPGNHDLWPHDFPLFAPARTATQARAIRECRCFPSNYPVTQVVQAGGLSVEFVLLDSTIPDSIMNTCALGALGHEFDAVQQSMHEQLARLPPPQHHLRVAVIHHPVADLPTQGRWRSVQQQLGVHFAMVLLDAAKVRADLLKAGVSVVLCGHEHQLPKQPQDALIENSQLLLLQAGCPTLSQLLGNADPHFCRYDLQSMTQGIELTWRVRHLDPVCWSDFGRFIYSSGTWTTLPPRSAPTSGSGSGRRARAPFP